MIGIIDELVLWLCYLFVFIFFNIVFLETGYVIFLNLNASMNVYII